MFEQVKQQRDITLKVFRGLMLQNAVIDTWFLLLYNLSNFIN